MSSIDLSHDATHEDALDLAQFHGVFFEEAAENLDTFERLLVDLDPSSAPLDTLHAIFRCAHSVKGGAATFGFTDIASLTHAMETLLDRLRRGEQALSAAIVDTLLRAGDVLRRMLEAHRGGPAAESPDAVLAQLQSHIASTPVAASAPVQTAVVPSPAASSPVQAQGERDLEMLVEGDAALAQDLIEIFREVTGAGSLEWLQQGDAGRLRFRLRTSSSDADLLDICSFHAPRERIRLAPWPATDAAAPAAASESLPAAATEPPTASAAPATAIASAAPAAAHSAAETTLRVSLRKVDQLINLMGELVITQAMLAQRAAALEPRVRASLSDALGTLERTTRDMQASVMGIRMIPMSDVFSRFPRMLRDLAARLGKQVELRTSGEATELDKGLIEKITDPLTHLVRNALDHGIELPAQRLAAGKSPRGILSLAARHEDGCVVIEVRDDGRGLDRARILAKARAQGLPLSEAPTVAEIDRLIFAPGFSTASEVTDISGRGVGMDVVRRNIVGLGGAVDIDTVPGQGTCIRVRLPLTLAIMDGMSVSVCGELYILPIASVLESFQPAAGAIRTMGGTRRVVRVRGEPVPVVSLSDFIGGPRLADGAPGMLVLVQSEGRTVALEVQRLVGQQQVVVKNLEANWRKVPGVSGATILGDGSVALILDVGALVRSTAAPAASQRPVPNEEHTWK